MEFPQLNAGRDEREMSTAELRRLRVMPPSPCAFRLPVQSLVESVESVEYGEVE